MSPQHFLMQQEGRTGYTKAFPRQRLAGLSFNPDHEKARIQSMLSVLLMARGGDLYIQELLHACRVLGTFLTACCVNSRTPPKKAEQGQGCPVGRVRAGLPTSVPRSEHHRWVVAGPSPVGKMVRFEGASRVLCRRNEQEGRGVRSGKVALQERSIRKERLRGELARPAGNGRQLRAASPCFVSKPSATGCPCRP